MAEEKITAHTVQMEKQREKAMNNLLKEVHQLASKKISSTVDSNANDIILKKQEAFWEKWGKEIASAREKGAEAEAEERKKAMDAWKELQADARDSAIKAYKANKSGEVELKAVREAVDAKVHQFQAELNKFDKRFEDMSEDEQKAFTKLRESLEAATRAQNKVIAQQKKAEKDAKADAKKNAQKKKNSILEAGLLGKTKLKGEKDASRHMGKFVSAFIGNAISEKFNSIEAVQKVKSAAGFVNKVLYGEKGKQDEINSSDTIDEIQKSVVENVTGESQEQANDKTTNDVNSIQDDLAAHQDAVQAKEDAAVRLDLHNQVKERLDSIIDLLSDTEKIQKEAIKNGGKNGGDGSGILATVGGLAAGGMFAGAVKALKDWWSGKGKGKTEAITPTPEDKAKAEAEQKAKEKAEADRKAKEAKEKAEREKAEADRKAKEKAEADRKAKEKAEADRKVKEKADAEAKAKNAEAERIKAEQARSADAQAQIKKLQSEGSYKFKPQTEPQANSSAIQRMQQLQAQASLSAKASNAKSSADAQAKKVSADGAKPVETNPTPKTPQGEVAKAVEGSKPSQTSEEAKKVAESASKGKGAKALKIAGTGVRVGGGALAIYTAYQQYKAYETETDALKAKLDKKEITQEEYDKGVKDARAKAVTGAAGGMVSGLIAAKAGGVAGASIGTALGGPVGTFIGGLIGALGAGYIGAEYGEELGKWVATAKQMTPEEAKAIADAYAQVKDADAGIPSTDTSSIQRGDDDAGVSEEFLKSIKELTNAIKENKTGGNNVTNAVSNTSVTNNYGRLNTRGAPDSFTQANAGSHSFHTHLTNQGFARQ